MKKLKVLSVNNIEKLIGHIFNPIYSLSLS